MTKDDVLGKVCEIVAAYFNGPNGEPNVADAHDYLCDIKMVLKRFDTEQKVARLSGGAR